MSKPKSGVQLWACAHKKPLNFPTVSDLDDPRSADYVGGMTKSVLITGAGSGIGAATAVRFASEGWDVVLVGRRPDALKTVSELIAKNKKTNSSYGVAHNCPLDISKPEDVKILTQWLDSNADVAGRLSAVVHNAGIYEQATTLLSSDESWRRMFETNLFGVIRLTQALYPLVKANRGSFTTVSSTLGLRPTPNTPAYSASKAALINWGHSFAKEVAADGVRVNCVCPGIVDTPIHSARPLPGDGDILKALAPLHPLGRVGRPEEVASMIWNLSGPGSEWTTGAVVNVDGGINLV